MLLGALIGLTALQTAAPPQAPVGYRDGLLGSDLRERALPRRPMAPQTEPSAGQPRLLFRFGPVGPISGRVALDGQQRIYMTSQDGYLYALTPDGRLRFRRLLTDAGGPPPITVRGGPALVPSGPCAGTSAGLLRCFDHDGNLTYEADVGGAIEDAPLADGSGELFVSAGKHLFRVNPQESRAPQRLLTARNKLPASPVADSTGRLFVGSHDRRIYGLTISGEPLWQTSLHTTFDASPALLTRDVLLAAGDHGQVYHLRTEDGAVLDERSLSGHVRAQPQSIAGQVWLQTFGPRPALLAVDMNSLQISRQVHFPLCDTTECGSTSAPTMDGHGLLWLGGPDDAIYAFDTQGRLHYRAPVGGRVNAQPIINRDDTVIVGAEDGYLYGLSALTEESTKEPP